MKGVIVGCLTSMRTIKIGNYNSKDGVEIDLGCITECRGINWDKDILEIGFRG